MLHYCCYLCLSRCCISFWTHSSTRSHKHTHSIYWLPTLNTAKRTGCHGNHSGTHHIFTEHMRKPGQWCKSYYWINTTTGFVAAWEMIWPCDPSPEKSLKFRWCVVPKRLQEEDEEQYLNMFFLKKLRKWRGTHILESHVHVGRRSCHTGTLIWGLLLPKIGQ